MRPAATGAARRLKESTKSTKSKPAPSYTLCAQPKGCMISSHFHKMDDILEEEDWTPEWELYSADVSGESDTPEREVVAEKDIKTKGLPVINREHFPQCSPAPPPSPTACVPSASGAHTAFNIAGEDVVIVGYNIRDCFIVNKAVIPCNVVGRIVGSRTLIETLSSLLDRFVSSWSPAYVDKSKFQDVNEYKANTTNGIYSFFSMNSIPVSTSGLASMYGHFRDVNIYPYLCAKLLCDQQLVTMQAWKNGEIQPSFAQRVQYVAVRVTCPDGKKFFEYLTTSQHSVFFDTVAFVITELVARNMNFSGVTGMSGVKPAFR